MDTQMFNFRVIRRLCQVDEKADGHHKERRCEGVGSLHMSPSSVTCASGRKGQITMRRARDLTIGTRVEEGTVGGKVEPVHRQ